MLNKSVSKISQLFWSGCLRVLATFNAVLLNSDAGDDEGVNGGGGCRSVSGRDKCDAITRQLGCGRYNNNNFTRREQSGVYHFPLNSRSPANTVYSLSPARANTGNVPGHNGADNQSAE